MTHGSGIHGIQVTGVIPLHFVIIQHIGTHIIIMAGGIRIHTTADIILPIINTDQMMVLKSEIIPVLETAAEEIET